MGRTVQHAVGRSWGPLVWPTPGPPTGIPAARHGRIGRARRRQPTPGGVVRQSPEQLRPGAAADESAAEPRERVCGPKAATERSNKSPALPGRLQGAVTSSRSTTLPDKPHLTKNEVVAPERRELSSDERAPLQVLGGSAVVRPGLGPVVAEARPGLISLPAVPDGSVESPRPKPPPAHTWGSPFLLGLTPRGGILKLIL